LRIKYIKGTKITRANILSRKPRYKEKQETKGFFIFRNDKDNLILNKRQLVFIIYIDCDLFMDKIKAVYNSDIIAEQIP
jgi:hypothetical protein